MPVVPREANDGRDIITPVHCCCWRTALFTCQLLPAAEPQLPLHAAAAVPPAAMGLPAAAPRWRCLLHCQHSHCRHCQQHPAAHPCRLAPGVLRGRACQAGAATTAATAAKIAAASSNNSGGSNSSNNSGGSSNSVGGSSSSSTGRGISLSRSHVMASAASPSIKTTQGQRTSQENNLPKAACFPHHATAAMH